MNLLAFLYVGIGGAFGSMGRYAMMSLIGHYNSSDFPFATLLVNVLGGFLMGALVEAIATLLPAKGHDLHLLLAVGVLGGFTTFSAFSLDVVTLIDRGLLAQAAVYVIASVAVSVLALMAGMACAPSFSHD